MAAETYDFPDHESGDTFGGVTFTILVNAVALNLTGAVIVGTFKAGGKTYTASTTNGALTITNAAGGIFTYDEQVVSYSPATYSYEIVFTLSTGAIKTYIQGTWKILR